MPAPDADLSHHEVRSQSPVSEPAHPTLVAVLDMGASAIRLAIAELRPNDRARNHWIVESVRFRISGIQGVED
jgi:hypothetical protein